MTGGRRLRPGHRPKAGAVTLTLALGLVLAGCAAGQVEESAAATGQATGASTSSTGGAPPAGSSGAPTSGETDEGSVESASASPTTSRSAGSEVDVVLTYGEFDAATDTVRVGGFAAGIVAADGTCSLSLSRSGEPDAEAEGPAEPDANSTACGELVVDGGQLSAGSWTARLAFSSGRGTGESDPLTIEVP